MNPAQSERHALCNLFLEVGPDAPTLCEGWNTRDLAAHIIVRESRPDAAGGILIKPLAAYGEKVRKGVALRDWKSLVEAIRNGPPRLSPMRLTFLDRLTNTLEFFVHLEDVRRAQPNWEPRTLLMTWNLSYEPPSPKEADCLPESHRVVSNCRSLTAHSPSPKKVNLP